MDVFITGMGVVSPHGRGVSALWRGLLEGRAALTPLTLFDASMFRNPLAGVVADYPLASNDQPARALRMLYDAADEAMRDALGLETTIGERDARAPTDENLSTSALKHIAIVTGTNFGGMSAAEIALTEGRVDARKGGLDKYLFGAASNGLAERFGFFGSRFNLSLACASGAAAIGLAFDLIRRGRADAVIAAGYDELSMFIYAGLSALRAITPETIRPFDKRRKGTLFSEGAGVMILESAACVERRKAPHIYARVLGRAMNNDAYHMTAPEQEARGIQALMRAVLTDAKIAPEMIDHINLHGTGTLYNDAIETKAIHAVFGERGRKIPVCAIKSSIGHTMGAAGIIETIATVLTLREGKVPPIVGLDPSQKDPDCDLFTPTGAPLSGDFKIAMKTSYGFGGANAALALEKV